jgi:hypothetical protein
LVLLVLRRLRSFGVDGMVRALGWLLAAWLVGVVLVTSGPCQSERVLGKKTTRVGGREVFVMEDPPCDDTNSCMASVVIDGTTFLDEGCLPDDHSGGTLVAVSDPSGSEPLSEARSIAGVAPDGRLAGRLRYPIPCGEWVSLVAVGER